MKKHILYAMTASCIALASCSEDAMDRINQDNEHPQPDAVPAYLQLTEAIMSTGFSTVSGDYDFYVASLTEQMMGVGNNQLMKAELRNPLEWSASTTFNNVWNSTYSNLLNLRQMQQKVENEVSGNLGHVDILGMAQVLEALNFGILTDMHGDIPYSEALQGLDNLQPKLDAQKEVYTGILATLDKAIDNLTDAKTQGLNNAKAQDLLFSGDPTSWLAFAHALKARYLLHQTAVDATLFAQVATEAQAALTLGFSGAAITEFNGVTCDNPWSAYHWSRSYSAASSTVSNLMTAKNDPRLACYTFWSMTASNPGDESAAELNGSELPYPAWLEIGGQPLYLMSGYELNFILAEAQLRQGADATAAFEAGVEASVKEIIGFANTVNQGNNLGQTVQDAEAEAAAYVAALGTPTLQKVFEEKYVAMSYDGQAETYNDLRRLDAMGESYITLTNPNNTQSGINRFPYVLPYGNSAVLGNPNVKEAYGDGTYIYTQKTWVNGGE